MQGVIRGLACLVLTLPPLLQAQPAAAVHAGGVAGPTLAAFAKGPPKLIFNQDISAILGADDDYTRTLSSFDYAAKFGSAQPLDATRRTAAFKLAVQHFEDRDIKRLQTAFGATFARMKGMDIVLPETLHVFHEDRIEAGAAYTRANAICMPLAAVRSAPAEALADLAAHELFHVISRYNRKLRSAIYATLGFKPVEPLILAGDLAKRTIANPDAPDNNYAIPGNHQGESLHFMPILYSNRDYQGGSFFHYLHDDLIAVEILNGAPRPIVRDGRPLIVAKDAVKGYYDQVGRNTRYTFHPEETAADHFKLLLFHDPKTLPNPEKISALEKILRP